MAENSKIVQTVCFKDILDIPEARSLVELIEELINENEPCLVEIRNSYIDTLYKNYGYKYNI